MQNQEALSQQGFSSVRHRVLSKNSTHCFPYSRDRDTGPVPHWLTGPAVSNFCITDTRVHFYPKVLKTRLYIKRRGWGGVGWVTREPAGDLTQLSQTDLNSLLLWDEPPLLDICGSLRFFTSGVT